MSVGAIAGSPPTTTAPGPHLESRRSVASGITGPNEKRHILARWPGAFPARRRAVPAIAPTDIPATLHSTGDFNVHALVALEVGAAPGAEVLPFLRPLPPFRSCATSRSDPLAQAPKPTSQQ